MYSVLMAYPSKTDRQAILTTAMDQVVRGGIEKLAIRSIAAALNLAPNALYRYFPNLAALQSALAEESRRRLLEVLIKAAARKTPEGAIRAIALAYMGFAGESPRVFALTLMPGIAVRDDESVHVDLWRFVLKNVARLYGEERSPEAAVALWAFLHGMTALQAAGVFGEMKPTTSFDFGLTTWIKAAG